jgi:hypothetical protein
MSNKDDQNDPRSETSSADVVFEFSDKQRRRAGDSRFRRVSESESLSQPLLGAFVDIAEDDPDTKP